MSDKNDQQVCGRVVGSLGVPRGNHTALAAKGLPWDAKLVVGLLIIISFYTILVGLLFMVGLAKPLDPDYRRLTFFSLIGLESTFWWSVEDVLAGAAYGIAVYGLVRRRVFGWWIALVSVLVNLLYLVLNASSVSAFVLVWGALLFCVLLWLLFRRKIYRQVSDRPG